MELQKGTIIRSADKKGTHTVNSEYLFHFSSYPVHKNISLYEGHFKNRSENKGLHYHKIMTEIFTVLQGEFFFNTADEEHILQPNDTIIIPPLVVHGFRAKIPGSRLQFVSTDITDREDFFLGLAKIINGEMVLNEEELEAFYNRHDQYLIK
jgi:mannose-6-phosphate isomerase-like protein (cupin superfamily)